MEQCEKNVAFQKPICGVAEESEDCPTLYFHPGSYFSQIGMLALHEKRVRYKPHIIAIHLLENMKPWFLKLNPKGQIPVLNDGGKSVPGTEQIFPYLDERYSTDNFPKLMPPKGTEEFKKMEKFDQLLRTFRNLDFTQGTMFFPELSSGVKIPEYEQNARKGAVLHFEEQLKKVKKEYPEISDILEERKKRLLAAYELHTDIEAVKKNIAATGILLDQVENELSSHVGGEQNWWLCCDQFTPADVILAIFLQRLDILGHTSSLLDPSKRPCLVAYKARLEQRPAYREYLEAVEELHRRSATS